MSLFKTIKYVHFHNNTDLPVNISSWVDGSNTLQNSIIQPGAKHLIHSSVGEWHIDSMFHVDSEEYKIWKERGLSKHHIIGKFRSRPCASGNYSWLEYDEPFECIYVEVPENKVPGLITLSIK